MPSAQTRDPKSTRTTLTLLVLAVLAALSLVGGCAVPESSDSPEDNVISNVKDNNADEPWMSHVTDWSGGGIADFSPDTDFPTDEVESYVQAVAICEAIRSEIATGADEPLIRVFGIESKTTTKFDGTTKTEKGSEMIAQFATYSDECGATAPYKLEPKLKKAGVSIF